MSEWGGEGSRANEGGSEKGEGGEGDVNGKEWMGEGGRRGIKKK